MKNPTLDKSSRYVSLIGAAVAAAAGVYLYISHSAPAPSDQIRGAIGIQAAVSVTTSNYDNYRTGANPYEMTLTPSNVNSSSFGKLFSLAVDGQIYAQPLYLQNVAIDGKGTHNVVFVATMHNTVYAFDADMPATPLWSVNLGPSVPTALSYSSNIGPYTDITPENGILGTPVIDPSTGWLYAVAATLENGKFIYRLHALDTRNGSEQAAGPIAISASVAGTGDSSVNGTVAFDASAQLQRPGLLLSKGSVYAAFGSHGDGTPYHGWIIGYNAQNLQSQVSVFNATPNGSSGAFWQSGRGIATDDGGSIYGVSSNGDSDGVSNFGNSVIRLDPTATKVADFFAPYNMQELNDSDIDLDAGPIVIAGTNFAVAAGKQGVIYLLDRNNLGHSGAMDSQIVQRLDTGNPLIFNMALWNRPDGPVLYVHTANAGMTAYRLSGGKLGSTPFATSNTGFPVPYQGMTVSSNGTMAGSGILWVLGPVSSPRSAGVLHAYNGDTLNEIWNSTMTPGDAVGGYVKFSNPTVANGKVYVPTTSNQLQVYGLTGTSTNAATTYNRQAPAVTGVVNAASYANGPLSPGEIVAILGQNLGPQTPVAGSPDANGNLSAQLGGTQVTFNGIPGPLYSTSSSMIAAIVPYEVSSAQNVQVVVSYRGQQAPPQTFALAQASPGLFSYDSSGSGPGAILNADNTLNSPQNPAAPSSVVVVNGTGGGQTKPPATTGATAATANPLAADVSATVGGQTAQVISATGAPGAVAGSVQFTIQLPDGVSGTVPVVVTVAGASSPATVTVSIQAPGSAPSAPK